MEITQIEELSRSRSKVYIDEEFAFVLYRGELRRYHIGLGEEISQADYDEIMHDVLPKRAKLRAMNLLKGREYTTKQLYRKLQEGYYPEAVISQALDYVAGFCYTDDLRYAETYISDHENSRSRRRIEQDLLNRGIDREILRQAWLRWEEKGGVQDEMALINRLLEKRGYDFGKADDRERQKMYGFLMRKGFSGDKVCRALHINDTST